MEMTTIIGIHAYDPNHEKNYILIAADSQRSSIDKEGKLEGTPSYDAKKILYNKKDNFILANCGTYLNPKISSFNKKTEKAFNKLLKEENSPEEIKKHLEEIGKQYKNNYVVGSNFNENLMLKSYSYKSIKLLGKEILRYLEESKKLNYSVGGSGLNYAFEIIEQELKDKIKSINGLDRIILSSEEAIQILLESMINASKKDEFTGGHMDIASITQNRWIRYVDFASLKKPKEFSKIKKIAENKLKKNTNLSGQKLDEIILG
jgi:hypothetical protein